MSDKCNKCGCKYREYIDKYGKKVKYCWVCDDYPLKDKQAIQLTYDEENRRF